MLLSANMSNLTAVDTGSDSAIAILSAFNFWLLLLIIVVGFSGNIFAVVVILASSKLRRVSSNHYLVALALSDSVFVIGLFMIWLNRLGPHSYHFDKRACKCVLFLLNSSGCLSSWYVMVLTAERFVVVYYPLYRRAMCSIGRTRRTIAALVPWPLLFNVWVLFAAGLDPRNLCDILPEYYQLSLVLNGVDMAISFVVPVLAIVAFNTAICVRLWSGENKSFAPTPAAPPASMKDGLRPGLFARSASRTQKTPLIVENSPEKDVGGNEGMQKHSANAKMQHQERKITQTLLIISFVYVALNMPSYSVRLRDSLMVFMGAKASDMSLTEKVFRNAFLMIYYMNFALNFIVYSLSSKNFRDAVKNLRCSRRQKQTLAGTNSSFYSHVSRNPGVSRGPNTATPSPYSSRRNSRHLIVSVPSSRKLLSPDDARPSIGLSTTGLTSSKACEGDETDASIILDSQCVNGVTDACDNDKTISEL